MLLLPNSHQNAKSVPAKLYVSKA